VSSLGAILYSTLLELYPYYYYPTFHFIPALVEYQL
jgi:hypothetical protein